MTYDWHASCLGLFTEGSIHWRASPRRLRPSDQGKFEASVQSPFPLGGLNPERKPLGPPTQAAGNGLQPFDSATPRSGFRPPQGSTIYGGLKFNVTLVSPCYTTLLRSSVMLSHRDFRYTERPLCLKNATTERSHGRLVHGRMVNVHPHKSQETPDTLEARSTRPTRVRLVSRRFGPQFVRIPNAARHLTSPRSKRYLTKLFSGAVPAQYLSAAFRNTFGGGSKAACTRPGI